LLQLFLLVDLSNSLFPMDLSNSLLIVARMTRAKNCAEG
jgi:hypothetical protein